MQENNQLDYTDFEYPEFLETDEVCRACNEGYMVKECYGNGPDDYIFTWTCPKCGVTESE